MNTTDLDGLYWEDLTDNPYADESWLMPDGLARDHAHAVAHVYAPKDGDRPVWSVSEPRSLRTTASGDGLTIADAKHRAEVMHTARADFKPLPRAKR